MDADERIPARFRDLKLLGSIAFQISARYSFASAEPAAPGALFRAGVYTAAGGLCFLVGSYLMIPELFDEEPVSGATPQA